MTSRFVRRLAVIGISGAVILFAAWLRLRPAFRSEASIREALLSEMPIGSSTEDVRAWAGKRSWADPAASPASYMSFSSGTAIDVTAFAAVVARDPFPYSTVVVATWEFDTNNRLVNIMVVRHQ